MEKKTPKTQMSDYSEVITLLQIVNSKMDVIQKQIDRLEDAQADISLSIQSGKSEEVLQEVRQVREAVKNVTARPPELLDVRGAAKLLGMTEAAIYTKVHNKLIPYFKQGGRLLFKRSELEKWVFSARVKTRDEMRAEAEKFTQRNRRALG